MAEPVPVTTLTTEELSLFEPGSTVSEELDALPQFLQTQTAQRGGPALFRAGGDSYLSMRGLGIERTLVLFDGFRMPAAVRETMVAENRASFLIANGASYPGELDIDRWDMRVAIQTGKTEKMTGVFDALRVDRLALALDAVEVYGDRRDLNADGAPDLVADADRGTGQITAAAADHITTPKWGIGVVEQDFAELLVRGELTDGWGAGPLSLATGFTYRDQSFSDGSYPIEIDEFGPPFNAPNLGFRGIASTWSNGSLNLHQFSIARRTTRASVESRAGRPVSTSNFYATCVCVPRAPAMCGKRRSASASTSRPAAAAFSTPRATKRSRRSRSRTPEIQSCAPRSPTRPSSAWYISPAGPKACACRSTLTRSTSLTRSRRSGRSASSRSATSTTCCSSTCSATTPEVLSRALSLYLNLDLARARGLDFEIAYQRDVNLFDRHDESLSIRVLGGKLDERTSTVVGSAPAEFAGSRGFPDRTANVTVSYRVAAWSVQLQERFIDEVLLNRTWVEGLDVDDNTIPSRAWTNLVLGYQGQMRDSSNWRLTLSMQNLFDKDPPIIPSAGDTRFGAQATDNTYHE